MTSAERRQKWNERRRREKRWRTWPSRSSRPKDSPEARERHRLARAAKRDEWRAAGLCVACGRAREDAGMLCCRKCRGYTGKRPPRRYESRKWAEVDAVQGTCPRCGLRGRHECLAAIDPLARSGPGRIYPETGGWWR